MNNLRYNQGPVKWIHSHVIIYPNGSRISLGINGRFYVKEKFPTPRRREAVMATRAKHG